MSGNLGVLKAGGPSDEVAGKFRGSGSLEIEGEVIVRDVPYQLTMWTEDGRSDERFHGRLDVSFEAALRIMDSPVLLTLRLEDGRALFFRMETTTGRICSAGAA